MKEKVSQMFKDKLFLVMLVLGLLTIVAAAGVVTIQRGRGKAEDPYLNIQEDNQIIAQETLPAPAQVAGSSDAEPEHPIPQGEVEQKMAEGPKDELNGPVAQVGAGNDAAKPLMLNFSDASKMSWPVSGNVLLDYSMDTTIYFPTLDQYKCNPGIVIQSDVSSPVVAPANARVAGVGANEEIGNYVVLDLGNEYTATCGQLKEIPVVENEYLEKGQVIGYVSEPTKYYSVEGINVFFELMHKDQAVDPLDYME